MNTPNILHKMCQQILSDTDIKAICKSRGFPKPIDREILESFLLSDVGLTAVMPTLTPKEIALLHWLKLSKQAVEISFFEFLYQGKKSSSSFHSDTPTQRFSPIFKSVQTQLLRKGVLLINQVNAASKIEGWRFSLPDELAKFLPPPFETINHFNNTAGEVNVSVLAHKVASLTDRRFALANDDDPAYQVSLKNGQIMLGDSGFSVARLMQWRQSYWQGLVNDKSSSKKSTAKKTFPDLVLYAFAQLGPNEWVTPDALSTFLRIAYASNKTPKSDTICETGWSLGYLARYLDQGTHYYRLAPEASTPALATEQYLQCHQTQGVFVDLAHIPLDELALLNDMADFRLDKTGLYATPNLIKIGRTTATTQQQALFQWLKQHSTAFSETIKTLEQTQGKHIVHDNLLIAKVKDMSLKVQIQKALQATAPLVELPNNFIAFAPSQLVIIEKIVKKSGYAIKTRTD